MSNKQTLLSSPSPKPMKACFVIISDSVIGHIQWHWMLITATGQ